MYLDYVIFFMCSKDEDGSFLIWYYTLSFMSYSK